MVGDSNMKFYTDGSRIKLKNGESVIGWGAVCDAGVVCFGSSEGGSNVNAEIFAIRDLLRYLLRYKRKLIEFENSIDIETDSLTSIQIINGFLKNPDGYDVNESLNYAAAESIANSIRRFEEIGKSVNLIHVKGHKRNLGNNFADYVATQQSSELKKIIDDRNAAIDLIKI